MYAETFAKKWPEADSSLPFNFHVPKFVFVLLWNKIKPFCITQNQNCQKFVVFFLRSNQAFLFKNYEHLQIQMSA